MPFWPTDMISILEIASSRLRTINIKQICQFGRRRFLFDPEAWWISLFCSILASSIVSMLYFYLCLLFSTIFAQIADVDRLQHDLNRFLALPRYNETEKILARAGLRKALEGVGLTSFTQSFTSEETDEIGANVISIQAGPHYGTSDDRLVVVLANYDTKENSPGVDDNGSGVAAALETARAIASLDRLYKRENTVVYVFVDMKHQSFSGSHAFVEDVLLPLLVRSNSTVAGALVLDGLLHFDGFPTSQSMPDNFEEVFPGAADELQQHNHMGDFIQLISRAGMDETVAHSFVSSFVRSSSQLVNDWSFRPWIMPLALPLKNFTSIENIYKVHPYIFADHSSFYFHSHQDIDIPTAYVTDTLTHRGVKQYCSYCDGLYMISEVNLRFLTLITDTVIRTVIHLAGSDARVVLDELQGTTYQL